MSVEPLTVLRRLAASYALNLVHSWELPPAADRALEGGVYSPSLAELAATTNPIMSDVGPLFERAIKELGLAIPPADQAAWIVARHHAERIAAGIEPLYGVLGELRELSQAARNVVPDCGFVGDGLGIERLIGIYWSYDELFGNCYVPEDRGSLSEEEWRAILDRHARNAAADWLHQHADCGLA